MRIGVFIITDDKVHPRCLKSLERQTYKDFFYHINVKKPKIRYQGVFKDNNILENREEARKKMLKTDAEAFLILDSDIVLPPNAIEDLEFQLRGGKIKVLGGYVPGIPKKIGKYEHWVGGYVVGERDYLRLTHKYEGITKVDVCAVGCVMVSRDVLAKVCFKTWEKPEFVNDVFCPGKSSLLYDECLRFSAQVAKLGHGIFLHGNVVCEHLKH